MAKHVWTVLCKRAVVDKNDNTVSMFEAIEDVQIAGDTPLPKDTWVAPNFQVTLVSYLVRSDLATPEESKIKVIVFSPDGTAYEKTWTVPIDMRDHSRARFVTQFNALPVRGEGQHRIVIEVEDKSGTWTQAAEIPYTISAKKEAPSPSSGHVEAARAPAAKAQSPRKRRRPKSSGLSSARQPPSWLSLTAARP